MELELDKIEEDNLDWVKVLKAFYGPFPARSGRRRGSKDRTRRRRLKPLQVRPSCGSQMLYRISKNGSSFLACENLRVQHDAAGRRTRQADAHREISEHWGDARSLRPRRMICKRRGRFGEFTQSCSGYSVKNEKGEKPSCSTIINLDKAKTVLNPMPPNPYTPIPASPSSAKSAAKASNWYFGVGKARAVARLQSLPQVPRHEEHDQTRRRRKETASKRSIAIAE